MDRKSRGWNQPTIEVRSGDSSASIQPTRPRFRPASAAPFNGIQALLQKTSHVRPISFEGAQRCFVTARADCLWIGLRAAHLKLELEIGVLAHSIDIESLDCV